MICSMCGLFSPERFSGQAVVTGVVHPPSPPALAFIFVVHTQGSAFPLLVDSHGTWPTRATESDSQNRLTVDVTRMQNDIINLPPTRTYVRVSLKKGIHKTQPPVRKKPKTHRMENIASNPTAQRPG